MRTIGGMMLSLVSLLVEGVSTLLLFPLICLGLLLLSIGVSLFPRSVDEETLLAFYRTIRPFGLWRPIQVAANLSPEELSRRCERPWLTVFNVTAAVVGIHGFYLFPMYLVGHWYASAILWLVVAAASIVVLSFTWYPNLPEE